MKSIRWDRKRECFVLGDGTLRNRLSAFPLETALDVSLSSLRRALAREAGVSVPPLRSLPAPEPPPPEAYERDVEYYLSMLEGLKSEIVFETREPEWDVLVFAVTGQSHLYTHFQVENPVIDDKNTVVKVTNRIFSRPNDLVKCLWYSSNPSDPDERPFWSYHMICDPTGRTVRSIWQAYRTLCFSLTTSPSDLMKSPKGVQLALRLGRPDTLIGSPESYWLEVKSMDYLLSSAAEKIKLAQDVARFANADGGLLVIGLDTSKLNGVDIISRVTPLPMPARQVARYRAIIDAHVYPFVRGLDVFSVPCDGGELVVVSVPRQSEDDKPFVVHGDLGSITGKKVKGQFISVVQRRGNGAEYLSGPAIHGLLRTQRMRLG
jgi:hypothetical protein